MRSVNTPLKRSIGLTGMVFYGVGTMIGGGFYALLGKIVGQAGVFTPLSLLLAGALALVSAFSFAELSRRYPVSAGEVQYVEAAFRQPHLSQLVGILVILTGVVSSATLCAATGGFLLDLTGPGGGLPVSGLIALTAVILTAIAAWGVSQSVFVVGVITLIEAGTLLLIIVLSDNLPGLLADSLHDLVAQRELLQGDVIVAAAFLAFYAFVGFEDMVNMAEETRDAQRTMPRAIFIAITITVLLYLGVALVAIGLEDRQALAEANTPLALLLPETGFSAIAIGVISILAGLNGALVQLVMAARVLYGMARKNLAPRFLAGVDARTRTPLRATLLVGAVILGLATSFTLTGLAVATSFIILAVFSLVNASLAALRWRERKAFAVAEVPWLPLIATLSCLGMLLMRLATLVLPA
jgi:amino acid transporter